MATTPNVPIFCLASAEEDDTNRSFPVGAGENIGNQPGGLVGEVDGCTEVKFVGKGVTVKETKKTK